MWAPGVVAPLGGMASVTLAICSRRRRRLFIDVLYPVLMGALFVALLATLTISFVENSIIGEAVSIARTGAVSGEQDSSAEDPLAITYADAEIGAIAYVQILAAFAKPRKSST